MPAEVSEFVARNRLTATSGLQSAARTLSALALYGGVGLAAHASNSPIIFGAALAVQSLVLLGAYSALHEAAHRNQYRRPWLNRVAGVAWGAAVLVPYSTYRSYHLQHHAATATDDDPEPRLALRGLAHHAATMLSGGLFVAELALVTARTALGRPPAYVRSPAQRHAVAVDGSILALVFACAAIALAVDPGTVLRWWLAPLALSYTFLFVATALPEHLGCDDSRDPLANTRTVRSNAVFRYLYWNNNFHAEHHLCPSVPYQNLPELHDHLTGRHRHLSRSYLSFHLDVIRALVAGTRVSTAAPPD